MTRLAKNNADYFPHDNDMWSDRKIVALRKKFGLEGYAIWNLLLESLCESENFELASGDGDLDLLADFWGLEKDKLKEVLSLMAKIGLISRESDKIYCLQLRRRLQPLLDERARKRTWSKGATQRRWEKDADSGEPDFYELDLESERTSSSKDADGNTTSTGIRKDSKEKERKEKNSNNTYAQRSFAHNGSIKMSTEDFDRFWDGYPKKRAKQRAREKFLKLERTLLPTILAAVEYQKGMFEWRKNGGQYIPYPTTWIIGRRWEDHMEDLINNHLKHDSTKEKGYVPPGYVSSNGDADIIITEDDMQV